MSEQVFKWEVDFGRQGDLEGLFVAESEAIDKAIGRTVMFYEALGKHSCPRAVLEKEQFTSLSDDPNVVAFVKEHARTGYNPLNYIHLQCKECELYSNPEEVYTYICKTCKADLCDGCNEKHVAANEGHEVKESFTDG